MRDGTPAAGALVRYSDLLNYMVLYCALSAILEKVNLNRTVPKFIFLVQNETIYFAPLLCLRRMPMHQSHADRTSLPIRVACFDMKQKKFLYYVSYAPSFTK